MDHLKISFEEVDCENNGRDGEWTDMNDFMIGRLEYQSFD